MTSLLVEANGRGQGIMHSVNQRTTHPGKTCNDKSGHNRETLKYINCYKNYNSACHYLFLVTTYASETYITTKHVQRPIQTFEIWEPFQVH